MNKLKSTNAITLIALIITIIVMLILVGVTINFAINGGIINKAKTASSKMQIETEREQLLSAVIAALDSNISVDFEYLDNNLPEGFTKIADKTYKSASGNVFTVDDSGKITYVENGGNTQEPDSEDPEDPNVFSWASVGLPGIDTTKDYRLIINPNNDGYLLNFTDEGQMIMKPISAGVVGEQGIELNATDNISTNPFTISVPSFGVATLEVKESGNIEVLTDGEYVYYTKVTDNLGRKVTYNNTDWYVLYDDPEHGIELVSADAVGEVTLSGANYSDARLSYNNAIDTFVNECKNETGIAANIRNIGGPSVDNVTATVDFSNLEGFTPNQGVSFSQCEGENGLKAGSETDLEDFYQMRALYIFSADNEKAYWISSRYVYVAYNGVVSFRIKYCSTSGSRNERTMCYVHNTGSYGGSDSYGGDSSYTYSVRPVISIDSATLTSLLAN